MWSNITTPSNQSHLMTMPILNISASQQHNVVLAKSDVVVIVIYILIVVFGVIGNLLVIQYFGFYIKRGNTFNTYLIHLAIADLISSIVTPIQSVYMVFSGHIWHLGSASCKILTVIGPLTVNVSAWILASIAMERYRGVVTPLKPRWTKTKIHTTVGLIWFASLVMQIPYMGALKMVNNNCLPGYENSYYELSVACVILLLQSLIPIAFMSYTLSTILRTLKDRLKTLSSSQSSVNNQSKDVPVRVSFKVSKSPHPEIENKRTEIELLSRSRKYENCRKKLTRRSTSIPFLQSECRKKISNNLTPKFGRANSDVTSTSTRLFSVEVRALQNLSSSSPVLHENSNGTVTLQTSCKCTCREKAPFIDIENYVEQKQLLWESKDGEERTVLDGKKSIEISTGLTTCSKSLCDNIGSPVVEAIEVPSKKRSTFRKLKSLLSFEGIRKESNNLRQRQAIVMLVVTFSVFVICSLPYNIFYVTAIILIDIQKKNNIIPTIVDVNTWLSTLVLANSIMNCYIYAGMNIGFRHYCRSFFSWRHNRNKFARKRRKNIMLKNMEPT